MRFGIMLLIVAALLSSSTTQASPIFYTVENTGGDQWTYNYEVENDTGLIIDFFAILFDNALYQFDLADLGLGLEIDPNQYTAPAGWFPETVVNDPFFPEMAQFVFGPGDFAPTDITVLGFSISFTWLGGDLVDPAEQDFVFFDSQFNEFANQTQLRVVDPGPTPVPEPSTILLVGLGLLALRKTQRARR